MQTLFKKMAQSGSGQPKRMTLEAGPMTFHYIIDANVAYLTLAERGYPKVRAGLGRWVVPRSGRV